MPLDHAVEVLRPPLGPHHRRNADGKLVVQPHVFGKDIVSVLPELALAFGECAGDPAPWTGVEVGVAEVENVVAVEL